MDSTVTEIVINGITYVQKGAESYPAASVGGMEYVIVRTLSAGVFAGYLKSRTGQEVVLLKARRLWRWAGAASLSQLSVEGTKNPDGCMFPVEVAQVELLQAIEILPATEKAKQSIASVKTWKM